MALRIALFGQAPFGRDVAVRLIEAGHELVGVYTPPAGARPDPLAQEAEARGLNLLRYKAMRRKGQPIAERVAEHAALDADLNVLAFVTMILPEAVVDAPRHGSLCFHPSLLPRFRGGNALAWQIILGEKESGVTVFRPDAGVDTGPIVVQKGGIEIQPEHTSASLYFDQLYALGVDAVCEAVELIDQGRADPRPQDESRATFQGLVDDEVARIDWSRPAVEIDRLVRGCDPQPGAWARVGEDVVRLYSGCLVPGEPGSPGEPGAPAGTIVEARDGALLIAAEGGRLQVGRMRRGDGKKGPATEAGLSVGERLE